MEHGDAQNSPGPPLEDERPSKKRRISMHPPREVGLMRSVPGDKLSSFVGSASGIYFIRSVYGAIRGAHPTTSAQTETPESDHVPGEDDYLPSSAPNAPGRIWRDEETIQRPLSGVTFQDLVEWSGSYFANWHPFYPYLHAPSILEYLEKIPQLNEEVNDGAPNFQMTILRSIMSISLADRRQSQALAAAQYPTELVFQSYDDAVDCLQHVLTRPTTLLSLQAAISVQLFLVSMLRLNAASRLGGMIIRMALQLGLHRCPARFPSFSVGEKEHRQRIFWSLYSVDRFICQSMGLPLSLHDDDVDVCYSTAERHPGNQHPPDDRLRLISLIARQYTIRGQIIELRNKSLHYVEKDPDKAIAITARLSHWWNDVEDFHDTDGDQSASLLWPSCTWAVWISTFILFHAASSHHVSDGIVSRLADKALDVLHHLARRGSVWPEASATAVRDLRDRITRRPTRHPGSSHPPIGMEIRGERASDGPAMSRHCTSSSGLMPQAAESAAEPSRTASSTGLPQEITNSYGIQPAAGGSNDHDNRFRQGVNTLAVPENAESFTAASPMPQQSINIPVFDFGNSEWTDFMQASDTFDSSIPLSQVDSMDPYIGFDIPFWLGQDQYQDILQDRG
ncbi:hypothetical protein E8E12_001901 [Didymella heteroderae]|uniref:Xylanolytic transcriptional activator regulatory domain-containing protein n=1 Tax=Didymella heteroderae TaxID=1769908 RepID=A0A9P4WVS6_9PLEO|nr:hypothetical protein E8E12_001901 [Didymella heteroderae]